MKILIPTIGSRRDVQPFIALAQGLCRSGLTVTLAIHPVMKPLVESQDALFAPIGPDIDLAHRVAAIRSRTSSTAMRLMQGMKFGCEMLVQSHEDIMAVCRSADLVWFPRLWQQVRTRLS